MRFKRNTVSLLITISLLLLLLIPSSAKVIANNISDKAMIAYGQENKINSNLTNQLSFQNIPPKKIHVGDIDVAYKIFGRGSAQMEKQIEETVIKISKDNASTLAEQSGVEPSLTDSEMKSYLNEVIAEIVKTKGKAS